MYFNDENKISIFKDFSLWIKNIKDNKLSFVCRFVLFIFTILVTRYSFVEYFNKHFWLFFFFLIMIYAINEISEIKEIKEKENLKKLLEIKSKEISTLELSIEYLGQSLSGLPKDFLRHVSKYLDLSNSDRISLYVFDETKFQIIGRYSENPLYDYCNREEYPRDEGYIAKCFENSDGKPYFYRNKLPKNTQKRYFEIVSKETGMSIDFLKKLSMKSRAYFGRLVKDDNKDNVGILLIETINPDFNISPEDLNEDIEKLIIPHLKTMLEISNKLKEDESYEN